jgi:hypothetical protein
MKTTAMLALCVAVAGLFGFAAAEEKTPGTYELTVSGTVYQVDLEKPFTIKAPDGKALPAVLRKAAGVYSEHGLRFLVPAGMTVRAKPNPGRVLIMVKSPVGYFAQIQLFHTAALAPEDVNKLMVSTIRKNLVETGVEFGEGSTKECERTIAGKVRKGVSLQYNLKKDDFRTDLYSFYLDKKILSICLQNKTVNDTEARKAFDRILAALRLE